MDASSVNHDLTKSATRLTGRQQRELDHVGYIALNGILSQQECGLLSRAVDELWEKEQTANHDYVGTPGVRFTANLLRHSLLFERCLVQPLVLDAVRAVLGPDIFLFVINARRADRGYGNQPLHDLKRSRGKPFRWCNAIWCLDEFTPKNGSTRVIPGSHLTAEPFLSRCSDPALPHPDECRIEASRGSVVILNSHLIHGGSTNETTRPRRCIHVVFTLKSETHYDWRELPESILKGLMPQSLDLIGLGSSEGNPLL